VWWHRRLSASPHIIAARSQCHSAAHTVQWLDVAFRPPPSTQDSHEQVCLPSEVCVRVAIPTQCVADITETLRSRAQDHTYLASLGASGGGGEGMCMCAVTGRQGWGRVCTHGSFKKQRPTTPFGMDNTTVGLPLCGIWGPADHFLVGFRGVPHLVASGAMRSTQQGVVCPRIKTDNGLHWAAIVET
jgi:hypothetical protein